MHTAVFDIGKTNKKFSVFDENLSEIHREYTTLPETADEDGFPTEDLPVLSGWMKETLRKALFSKDFRISKLNFSTYGASMVHLNAAGKPVTPLYNYLKPFPEELLDPFFAEVGGKEDFCVRTASPWLGMLNAGLQLYWLGQKRPDVFRQIRHALHFPQFCSYLFSKQLRSEYTSIGCHTGLWDYAAGDYHAWVKRRGMDKLFPPCLPATLKTEVIGFYKLIDVGAGIHDSSAALLPYLLGSPEPFLLLSTGTWNITFNPFREDLLTPEALRKDCLNYMRLDGAPVRASRLFFGNEFNKQTARLAAHFGKTAGDYPHRVAFDEDLYRKWSVGEEPLFRLESLQYPDGSIASAPQTRLELFPTFEEAFHRLMIEMMRWQAGSIRLAAGAAPVRKLYVDGGFSQSNVFLRLLRVHFPDAELVVSAAPLGSSLGAALAVNQPGLARPFIPDAKGIGAYE